ncbi:SDR family NAD(P)-dependent oxidoreductase [Mumia sp. DW29H23]|uniref:SDR family NAD(P)-dependent oxidoreductase n=1 Tax=Mumia sp. DW29H23 TaxID=3421241 RepID=UPI003D68086A
MSTPTDQPRPLGIVTGASSGIGRALVDEFVRGGFDVLAVADEDADGPWPEDGAGARVRLLRADLATPTGNEKVVVAATADGRPVTAAALNAGVGVHGRFDRTDLGDHLHLLAVNVVSP